MTSLLLHLPLTFLGSPFLWQQNYWQQENQCSQGMTRIDRPPSTGCLVLRGMLAINSPKPPLPFLLLGLLLILLVQPSSSFFSKVAPASHRLLFFQTHFWHVRVEFHRSMNGLDRIHLCCAQPAPRCSLGRKSEKQKDKHHPVGTTAWASTRKGIYMSRAHKTTANQWHDLSKPLLYRTSE